MNDIRFLNLPSEWQLDIEKIISKYKMSHETWIESALNYRELVLKLRQRGYRNIADAYRPMFSNTKNYNQSPIVNLNQFENQKIMIRKP